MKQRAKDLPEEVTANSHYNEEGMIRRLGEFRKNNESETSSLTEFFKENSVTTLILPTEGNGESSS